MGLSNLQLGQVIFRRAVYELKPIFRIWAQPTQACVSSAVGLSTQETACCGTVEVTQNTLSELDYGSNVRSGSGTEAEAEARRCHALPGRATTDGPRRPAAPFDFCTPPRPNPRCPPVPLWTAARHRCLLGCGSPPLPRPSFSGRSAHRPRRELLVAPRLPFSIRLLVGLMRARANHFWVIWLGR